ncbi:MAG: FHA domain-containing protein [Anaerolineae bacterium]|jgi:hypothetical protein|nr:FHA domain-containing protein [Anaerolineae bacterium]
MSHVVVSLEVSAKEKVDFALPLNIPNETLAPVLAKVLEISEKEDDAFLFSVKTHNGIVRLAGHVTLGDAGILDGFVLQLQKRRKAPAPPPVANLGAFLETETGEVFPLNKASILIGRQDAKKGIFVDIDMKPFDLGKTVSRKHARIDKEQNQYSLVDLGSVNGTHVNGDSLMPKKSHYLKSGDVIEFGKGVEALTFKGK